jgi:hypothetical protein
MERPKIYKIEKIRKKIEINRNSLNSKNNIFNDRKPEFYEII